MTNLTCFGKSIDLLLVTGSHPYVYSFFIDSKSIPEDSAISRRRSYMIRLTCASFAASKEGASESAYRSDVLNKWI